MNVYPHTLLYSVTDSRQDQIGDCSGLWWLELGCLIDKPDMSCKRPQIMWRCSRLILLALTLAHVIHVLHSLSIVQMGHLDISTDLDLSTNKQIERRGGLSYGVWTWHLLLFCDLFMWLAPIVMITTVIFIPGTVTTGWDCIYAKL